jgi:hypothetical protein
MRENDRQDKCSNFFGRSNRVEERQGERKGEEAQRKARDSFAFNTILPDTPDKESTATTR